MQYSSRVLPLLRDHLDELTDIATSHPDVLQKALCSAGAPQLAGVDNLLSKLKTLDGGPTALLDDMAQSDELLEAIAKEPELVEGWEILNKAGETELPSNINNIRFVNDFLADNSTKSNSELGQEITQAGGFDAWKTRYFNLEIVDLNKIQIVNGGYPINAADFAGLKFTFNLENPRMNDIMEQRWRQQGLSQEQIAGKRNEFRLLHEKYPEGVPFSELGFPNFSMYRYEHNGVPVEVDIQRLNPDPPTGQGGSSGSQLDFRDANNAMKAIDPNWRKPSGYTWHHIENSTKLELVPTDLHQAVRHTGGRQTGTY